MYRSILAAVATVAIATPAVAETVFLAAKPASTITADQAADAKDGAFKCDRVKRGTSGNPVKVPGSETLWSANPGKGADDAAALLRGGKEAYRCKRMRMDVATARMKSYN